MAGCVSGSGRSRSTAIRRSCTGLSDSDLPPDSSKPVGCRDCETPLAAFVRIWSRGLTAGPLQRKNGQGGARAGGETERGGNAIRSCSARVSCAWAWRRGTKRLAANLDCGLVPATSHGLKGLPLAAQGPVSASLGQGAPAYRLEGLRAVNPEQHLHTPASRAAASWLPLAPRSLAWRSPPTGMGARFGQLGPLCHARAPTVSATRTERWQSGMRTAHSESSRASTSQLPLV